MTDNKLGVLWLFKEQFSFKEIPAVQAYEAYFKALLTCANGDGKITDQERDWVIGYAHAYHCDPSVIEQIKVYKGDEEDIETVISRNDTSSQTRNFLIYDAIKACSADGEYNEEERAVVHRGAKQLGISEDTVKQIEEICLEEAKIREKRLSVMFPNGAPI